MSSLKRVISAVSAWTLVVTGISVGLTNSAAQAAPVGAGFTLTTSDLQFIVTQIRIAEAHRARNTAGAPTTVTSSTNAFVAGSASATNIPDARLPWGLRQVDGANNNLTTGFSSWGGFGYVSTAGKSLWGAADQPFLRSTTPVWRLDDNGSSYEPRGGNLVDSDPRMISNLIADQSPDNPAAVAASGSSGSDTVNGKETLRIPNTAPNAGVAAPYNGLFALFGQFFDHGLDLVHKSGTDTVYLPLQADDPLCVGGGGSLANCDGTTAGAKMGLARTLFVAGTTDAINTTTPWVDQNQTYSSHASKQVFMREYALQIVTGMNNNTANTLGIFQNANARVRPTGQLLNGAIAGNMPNWGEVKHQSSTLLGICLVDSDITNVPLVLTDEYGRFLPGANGYPQLVTQITPTLTLLEGNPTANAGCGVSTSAARRTGHAFLDDIAHTAAPHPGLTPDTDTVVNQWAVTACDTPGTCYDDEGLNAHFITGDGRGNENIGLTSIHTVFHSEHNRLIAQIKDVVLNGGNAALQGALNGFILTGGTATPNWNGERLFQAARFVNEMEYQHLVFGEFVRKVQPAIRLFVAYDPTLRPDITAEFANAVYRYGHSQLNEEVQRTAADGTDLTLPLLYAFLNPTSFNNNGATNDGSSWTLNGHQAAGSIFRGMSQQVGNEMDEFVTGALRNSLLGLPLDLASLNLARGRDTGTAGLNGIRREFYNTTGNAALMPYSSWFEFSLNLKHQASAVNFIAAYGTHPSITGETTVAGKRAAAQLLVDCNPADIATPVDCTDFLFSTGAWAPDVNGVPNTGLEGIDLWIGGLAEARTEFGGMLGSTFDYIFKTQMEMLQEGDRFYYLGRTAGTNLGVQLETNFLSEIAMRNTDAEALPADVFANPSLTFNIQDNGSCKDQLLNNCAAGVPVFSAGYWMYAGGKHVVFNGSDVNADKMRGGSGNDTIRGNGGNDWMDGAAGDDILYGGTGDDILLDSGGGLDLLMGGDGADYLASGGIGIDTLTGGPGDDAQFGGSDSTIMLAGVGNDWVYGGMGADTVSGEEGSDWLEGGTASDILSGDIVAPFAVDIIPPGDDVIVPGSGNDISNGGGGMDIATGDLGQDIFLGDLGFDWQTYFASTLPAFADLLILNPAPGDIAAGMADGFLDVEALGGSTGNDTLKGDDRRTLALVGTPNGDILLTADIAKITGLQELLGAGVNNWNAGNILLGGAGSDSLEGRGGNDFIDGDANLEVWISVPNTVTVDLLAGAVKTKTDANFPGRTLVSSVMGIRQALLNRTLTTADMAVVRLIDAGTKGADIDTAVFTGNQADYTVAAGAIPGTITVTLTLANPGGNRDGVDTLRGIERLQFLDGTVTLDPLPVITSFTPASGPVTTSVVITGTGFTGATAVRFNGTASTFTVDSDTQITAAVPNGATTGRITVVNPTFTGTSATNFTVIVVPPTTPTGVAALPQGGSAVVSWTAVPGATTYTARAYSTSVSTVVVSLCTTSTVSCTISGLAAGATYYIDVTAGNSAGTSTPSTRVVAVIPSSLAAPAGVTATAAAGAATIQWSAVTGANSYVVRAYSSNTATVVLAICTTTTVSCTLSGLTSGTTYWVAVSAISTTLGEGAASTRVSVTPSASGRTVPGQPTAPTLSVANRRVTVTWAAPTNTGGSAITSYIIRWYTVATGGTPTGTTTDTTPATRTFTTGLLTRAVTYYFEVVAVNAQGQSVASTRTAITIP